MADLAKVASTTGPATPPVVEATGITKRFGATLALDDVSLTVANGDVHALVGRNGAGKSTLVSVLTGLHAADQGTVRFSGEPAPNLSDREGWRRSVACVYQKLTTVPALSVAENLYLNRQSDSSGPISWKRLNERAEALLAEWDLDVDVRTLAGDLSVEQRQMVEIARSLSGGARFIILDEPTARLDAAGIERLFDRVRALQAQGVTFLFISHHLNEIFQLCQQVTVYRDAKHIISAPIKDLSHSELVTAMTGEKVSAMTDPRPPAPPAGAPILEVGGLTVTDVCRDISFGVRAGEIVGLAGAGGSGKFAVAESLVGLRKPDAGTICIDGVKQKLGSVPAALRSGVGFVPEDRHREGFVGGLSIAENLTMSVPHRLGSRGVLSPRLRSEFAWRSIEKLDVVPRNPDQPAQDLSGGNQQKVVMARALADDPRVLVLMSPTAGVDVKSKQTLMNAATDAARAQSGVLVVTDDLDDLRYCHRIVIMFRGEVVAEVSGSWDDNTVVAAMEGVDLSDG